MKIQWKNLQNQFEELKPFLQQEYASHTVFPPKDKILNALTLPYDQVRVVILGQDPYHAANQANGLAFAVNNGNRHPPSLQNIFKELASDLEIEYPESSSLEGWKKQGVLLLNTILTVREATPLSHQNKGWEKFTDQVIIEINKREEKIIFLLWGSKAQAKRALISSHHHILTAVHPSPLSAYNGFFGCKHFSKVNQILKESNQEEIDWKQID